MVRAFVRSLVQNYEKQLKKGSGKAQYMALSLLTLMEGVGEYHQRREDFKTHMELIESLEEEVLAATMEKLRASAQNLKPKPSILPVKVGITGAAAVAAAGGKIGKSIEDGRQELIERYRTAITWPLLGSVNFSSLHPAEVRHLEQLFLKFTMPYRIAQSQLNSEAKELLVGFQKIFVLLGASSSCPPGGSPLFDARSVPAASAGEEGGGLGKQNGEFVNFLRPEEDQLPLDEAAKDLMRLLGKTAEEEVVPEITRIITIVHSLTWLLDWACFWADLRATVTHGQGRRRVTVIHWSVPPAKVNSYLAPIKGADEGARFWTPARLIALGHTDHDTPILREEVNVKDAVEAAHSFIFSRLSKRSRKTSSLKNDITTLLAEEDFKALILKAVQEQLDEEFAPKTPTTKNSSSTSTSTSASASSSSDSAAARAKGAAKSQQKRSLIITDVVVNSSSDSDSGSDAAASSAAASVKEKGKASARKKVKRYYYYYD